MESMILDIVLVFVKTFLFAFIFVFVFRRVITIIYFGTRLSFLDRAVQVHTVHSPYFLY